MPLTTTQQMSNNFTEHTISHRKKNIYNLIINTHTECYTGIRGVMNIMNIVLC